uniref:Uncharacterized protein n=1 Tax=Caenorhabditis tropicalis TaxID=1561998 RepID=A0A1I7TCT5_9PELO
MEDENYPLLPRKEEARLPAAPLLGLIGPALFFETPRRFRFKSISVDISGWMERSERRMKIEFAGNSNELFWDSILFTRLGCHRL